MATIRLASPEDSTECQEIYAPYVRDTPISFELTPPTAETVENRIERTLDTLPWLIFESGDDILGYAYAGQYRARAAYQWVVESSVYVDGDHHRRGIACGLYTSLFEILRLQGYFAVLAGMTLPNPSSVEFHRAMGFEPIGVYEDIGYKDGQWYDVEWMQRQLRPPADDPEPPVSLRELEDGLDEVLRLGVEEIEVDSD